MDDISSNIDQRLIEAYQATTYAVKALALALRIGEKNRHLEEFLIDNNEYSFAFVSAYNPYSQPLSEMENKARHLQLITWLKAKGFRYKTGYGIPDDSSWFPEKSVLILGISKKKAKELGNELEQNAVIFGILGKAPELVLLR